MDRGRKPVVRGELVRWMMLLGGALLATPAHADGAGKDGKMPGEWVTYRLDDGQGQISFLRIALVARARTPAGHPGGWVNVELGHEETFKTPLARMLVLFELGPSGELVRPLLGEGAAGAQASAPLSPQLVDALVSAPHLHQPAAALKMTEWGDVTVTSSRARSLVTAAGTLQATAAEVRVAGAIVQRVWTARAVPLTGLAKLEMPVTGHTIEVSDYGTMPEPATRKVAAMGHAR